MSKQQASGKNIKDYLHLYLGCQCIVEDQIDDGTIMLTGISYDDQEGVTWAYFENSETSYCELQDVKPILSPLSDMTEDELQECGNMVYDFSDDPYLNNHKWKDFEIGLAPEQFHWLLKQGFDLFGLIESGIAIDKTKLNSHV